MDNALQKLLQEIETQALTAQRDISIVKGSVASKQREIRLNELTSTELKGLPKETPVYEGVGRMFVGSSIPSVETRLNKETADLKGDVSALSKKLNYLETTYKNSRDHLDQILKGQRG